MGPPECHGLGTLESNLRTLVLLRVYSLAREEVKVSAPQGSSRRDRTGEGEKEAQAAPPPVRGAVGEKEFDLVYGFTMLIPGC